VFLPQLVAAISCKSLVLEEHTGAWFCVSAFACVESWYTIACPTSASSDANDCDAWHLHIMY